MHLRAQAAQGGRQGLGAALRLPPKRLATFAPGLRTHPRIDPVAHGVLRRIGHQEGRRARHVSLQPGPKPEPQQR